MSTCTTAIDDVGFLLTGDAGGDAAFGTEANKCSYDFLAIPGGQDQATFLFNDRYCGGTLDKICSMFDLLIITSIVSFR